MQTTATFLNLPILFPPSMLKQSSWGAPDCALPLSSGVKQADYQHVCRQHTFRDNMYRIGFS